MNTTIPVLDNPLFVDQLGDIRCPPEFPWYRGGRCWPHHAFDTHPDSMDNADPLAWWEEWQAQHQGDEGEKE